MDSLGDDKRIVRNLRMARFDEFCMEGEKVPGQSLIQLDDRQPPGQGFYIFRMEPGAVTTPHEHPAGEHFYVIDGDLRDHDGYEYDAGDLVYLKPGSIHNSTTRTGCTLVVYLDDLTYTA